MNTWRLKVLSIAALLTIGLAGIGCSSPQEPAVCQLNRDEPDDEGDQGAESDDDDETRVVRPVRAEEWLRLLVKAQSGQSADQECAGHDIALPEPSKVCREAAESDDENSHAKGISNDRAIQVPLTDDSVIDRRLTNSKRLVWVVTHEFSNGDGLGPIGLIERVVPDDEDEPEQLRVLAIGTLRARRERVRLRLITLRARPVVMIEGEICEDDEGGGGGGEGEGQEEEPYCERTRQLLTIDGVRCQNRMQPETCRLSRELRRDEDLGMTCTDDERADTCWYPRQVLIAEGEFCTATPDIEDDEEAQICYRAADFMFRDGERFEQAELHHMAGYCLGRAEMEYANAERVELPGSWRRDFNLVASYEIRGSEIIVYEQVVATDTFTGVPEIPPRPFRTAESVMHWYPFEGNFITNREHLWGPMLEQNGSIQLPTVQTASAE